MEVYLLVTGIMSSTLLFLMGGGIQELIVIGTDAAKCTWISAPWFPRFEVIWGSDYRTCARVQHKIKITATWLS